MASWVHGQTFDRHECACRGSFCSCIVSFCHTFAFRMTTIRFRCPACQKKLSVDSQLGGASVTCPLCSDTIQIPTQSNLESGASGSGSAQDVVMRQLEELKSENKKLLYQLGASERDSEENVRLQNELQRLRERAENQTEELGARQQAVKDSQNELFRLESKLQNALSESKVVSDERHQLSASLTQQREESDAARRELDLAKGKATAAQAQVHAEEKARKELEDNLSLQAKKLLEAQQQAEAASKMAEEAEQKALKAEEQVAQAKKESAESQRLAASDSKESLAQEAANWQERLNELERELETSRLRNQTQAEQLEFKTAEIEAQQSKIEAQESKIEAYQSESEAKQSEGEAENKAMRHELDDVNAQLQHEVDARKLAAEDAEALQAERDQLQSDFKLLETKLENAVAQQSKVDSKQFKARLASERAEAKAQAKVEAKEEAKAEAEEMKAAALDRLKQTHEQRERALEDRLRTEIKTEMAQREAIELEKNAMEAALATTKKSLEAKTIELTEIKINDRSEGLEKEVERNKTLREEALSQKQEAEDKLTALQTQLATIEQEKSQLEADKNTAEATVRSTQVEYQDLKTRCSSAEAQLDGLTLQLQKHQRSDTKDELSRREIKTREKAMKQEIAAERKRADALAKQADKFHLAEEKLKKQVEEERAETNRFRKQLDELTLSRKALKIERDEREKEAREVKEAHERASLRVKELESRVEDLRLSDNNKGGEIAHARSLASKERLRHEEQHRELMKDISGLQEKLDILRHDKTKLELTNSELKGAVEEATQALVQQKQGVEHSNQHIDQIEAEHEKLKTLAHKLQEQQKEAAEKVNRFESKAREESELAQEVRKESDTLRKEKERMTRELDTLLAERDVLAKEKQALEARLEEFAQQLEDSKNRLREAELKVRETSVSLQESAQRTPVEIQAMQTELDAAKRDAAISRQKSLALEKHVIELKQQLGISIEQIMTKKLR